MNIILTPRKSLNKAYLKQKPLRADIDSFKENLKKLIISINDTESEEFHKNLLSDFLKNTYYSPNHSINTKGRNDLVIHNGSSSSSSVGVLIEAKKPTNKAEMPSVNNLNSKAMQELVLYYLRERITDNNLEVKHLIITNISEWFIFDATVFEDLFAKNKSLVKQFNDFEEGRLSGTNTDYFYSNIAKPFIDNIEKDITFTHFLLDDYDAPLTNSDLKDDKKLIALYKLLSPEHLLKLPFANDSNTLNENFYKELLHLIGLTRVKDKGKELIDRHKEGERNPASLLENTITQLDDLDKLSRLENPSQFGETRSERLFNVSLELCITWVNRILFLKLLEAQLITYHKGDKDYEFLNSKKIKSFDDLNGLFFQVLAKLHNDRNDDVKDIFSKVPYLNSSLFEPTEIEHNALFISNLKDDKQLPIITSTVLKDSNGKRITGTKSTLEYIFDFLNSYDFSSEGSEDIQEENKTLINASVLGLIFEKINGYKDGSFFTPGFITEYMCRETIRRAVIQKFNVELENTSLNPSSRRDFKTDNPPLRGEQRGVLKTLDDVYDIIDENGKITRQKANDIINSITICDPAVGSGHFLVSALNEILAIKNDLRILQDRDGRRLKEYSVSVVNDELIITDENNSLFEYNYQNKESQRVQETIFHEKQTIIENCLFGVDINPNSVKICRLRLWIELLKHAYYKNQHELETLPNIDINIKCGNSLISRFEIDSDLKQALKSSKWDIHSYRNAVATYRNAKNKEEKREMERLINDIKSDFRTEINKNSKEVKKLFKLEKEQYEKFVAPQMFGETLTPKQKKKLEEEHKKINTKIEKAKAEIEEIKNNKIYINAFEWRFEFPEVLSEEGDFVGFDVVIGNPPYIKERDAKLIFQPLRQVSYWSEYIEGKMDLWYFFLHQAFNIGSKSAFISYITNSYWVKSDGSKKLIGRIFKSKTLNEIIFFDDYPIFAEVSGKHMIHSYQNSKLNQSYDIKLVKIYNDDFNKDINKELVEYHSNEIILQKDSINLELNALTLSNKSIELGEIYNTSVGIQESSDKIAVKKISPELADIFKGGEGVFVINKEEVDNLNLNEDELKQLKPYLNTHNVRKYAIDFSDEYLIFSDKEVRNDIENNKYPNLKKHLDKVNHFITSSNAPYGLHRTRSSKINPFDIPKLICPGMFKKPTFTYDNDKYYVGFSFSVIWEKDQEYDLKYLLGILNSKIGEYWFNTNGKKRGVGVDIGVKVFRKFPVRVAPKVNQKPIIELVNTILTAKKQDPEADTQELEDKIDHLVYKLYDLTYDEVLIVDPDTKLTREEY